MLTNSELNIENNTKKRNDSSYKKENNNNNNIDNIKEKISSCLEEIDPRFYDPNFNLISEIVNVFGDINFEKVKDDIERLKEINQKLDDVIKLIVDKHSDEFFKILGYVRDMKKMLENSKVKYNYAQVSLGGIKQTMEGLVTGENSEWKSKSLFYNEIISKLSKTQSIFEILNICSNYIQNNKIFDAIKVLINTENEYNEYDKEFRRYNLVTDIGTKFVKMKNVIKEKLVTEINSLCFFKKDKEDLILTKKIQSLILYIINYYSKLSIDIDLVKPMQKFISIINQAVNYKVMEELENYEIIKNNNEENNNNIDSKLNEKKDSSSLIYSIGCIKNFETEKILELIVYKLDENFSSLIVRIMKIAGEQLRNLPIILNKFDMENKTEKIKFLLIIEIPLIIFAHTISKLNTLFRNIKDGKIVEIRLQKLEELLQKSCEKPLILLLLTFQKILYSRQEELNSQNDNTNVSNQAGFYSFIEAENSIRRKINEMQYLSVDYLPMLNKLIYQFSFECNKNYKMKFNSLENKLEKFNDSLFQFYSSKISISKFFTLKSFSNDYDTDISNFKFIEDLTNKIEQLRTLLIFAYTNAYSEIMKILRDLFVNFSLNTKDFIVDLLKEKIHRSLINKSFDLLIKEPSYFEIINQIRINLKFKQFQTFDEIVKNKQDSERFYKEFNYSILDFIIKTEDFYPQIESLNLSIKDYKFMELLTRFIVCTETISFKTENFVEDLMNELKFENTKKSAIMALVGKSELDNISTSINIDIDNLIVITLTCLDKLSYDLSKILLILKTEFCCLLISLLRNIKKTSYMLKNPQNNPDYFINSFINDFLMFYGLFQNNLNTIQTEFICKDYLLLVNNIFFECLKKEPKINANGVNLLIKDFQYIKTKMGNNFAFQDDKFEKSIFYFENYANLLLITEDELEDKLRIYYKIDEYKDDILDPIIKLRKNFKH